MKKPAIISALLSLFAVFGGGVTHAQSTGNLQASSIVVVPDSGMWSFPAEQTGQPGRGFQLDTQGDTLVMSYYGYRADGAATFYLASGKLAGDSFSGSLMEYAKGTALGRPFQNGVELGSAGVVKITFRDSTHGTMTLPGEQPQEISRFVFSDASVELNDRYFGGFRVAADSKGERNPVTFHFTEARDGRFGLLIVATGGSESCKFTGSYELRGVSLSASGNYVCNPGDDGTFTAQDIKVDANGNFTAMFVSTTANGRETYTDYLIGR
ncbi:hypothetical protein [Diaphorobacter caeni]|uniref:hypothetical protein n=1 Tax=Diaphorobacter caeni TaxID=2784387 RepID=UPI00188F261E|nr:hypothetical protein [Diaphorobacter caeni]MBF5006434.1 hypothetical protein [Diaphorobacter caeni]